MMQESVTHVPGLICYLCTWTLPGTRLTSACSGGREASLASMASEARGPADAPTLDGCLMRHLLYRL
jgi:hypothetical protein